MINGEWLMVNG